MSDASNPRSPGPNILVVRAVFVPDGEQPPPEFSGVFDPLKFRATLDPATGIITCDNAGMSFLGDIRAEWHPDVEQGSADGQEAAGRDGDANGPSRPEVGTPDSQLNQTPASGNQTAGGGWPARSDGRTPFGLAGGLSRGRSPSLPKGLYPDATRHNDDDQTKQPPPRAAAPAANVEANAGADDAAAQPTVVGQPGGPGLSMTK